MIANVVWDSRPWGTAGRVWESGMSMAGADMGALPVSDYLGSAAGSSAEMGKVPL